MGLSQFIVDFDIFGCFKFVSRSGSGCLVFEVEILIRDVWFVFFFKNKLFGLLVRWVPVPLAHGAFHLSISMEWTGNVMEFMDGVEAGFILWSC